MVECEEEWESAREYGIPLPNCTDLPEQVTGKIGSIYLKTTFLKKLVRDTLSVILFPTLHNTFKCIIESVTQRRKILDFEPL